MVRRLARIHAVCQGNAVQVLFPAGRLGEGPALVMVLAGKHAPRLAWVHVVQHLARQLDVIVGELANLGVVDTQDLGFLGGAQMHAWDQVEDEKDERRADEGVGSPGKGVSELVAELDPVVVEPATLDDLDVVQMGDVVSGEKGGADVADQAADAVHGEDVEGVVDAEHELELGTVVGEAGAENAVDDCCPGRDVSLNVLVMLLTQDFKPPGCYRENVNLPDPGVMATRPATTPEQKPTVDHFRSSL